jgi:ubiquitin carboxyl-terminal hydrolase 4/11/15
MQSDASSSSPKRSVSGGIDSPLPDKNIVLSPSDPDIDAYMAEQGETDIHDTINIDTPVQNPDKLPPADKLVLVNSLRMKPMQFGDTWYLVSWPWYKRWYKACTGEIDKEGGINEQDLGPVDNTSLVDKEGNFISSAVEGVDVEFVPEEVWSHFTTWLV